MFRLNMSIFFEANLVRSYDSTKEEQPIAEQLA